MAGLRVFAASFLLVIWCCCQQSHGAGYMITTLRVYRSATVQRVVVNLHGDNKIYNVTAWLKITRSKKVISMATQVIPGDSQAVMDIQVPSYVPVRYNQFNNIFLEVQGLVDGKSVFKKKQALTLEKLENTLFIQTDKPIYKPGQTIRIRVIGIDSDLKPLVGKMEKILITSPGGTRMMQWNDVHIKNGIVNVKLPLSSQPLLGLWSIQVRHKQDVVKKTVEVAKYVLPKFEVVIEPPPFIAVDSKTITGSICARYTYNQPVLGKLNATLELKGKQKITIVEKIKGCYQFSFTNQDFGLVSLKQSYSNAEFTITANVTEEATGVTQSADVSVTKIAPHRVKLNFDVGTPRYFKPGLPFYGKLHVSTPDGQPIDNEEIIIRAQDDRKNVLFKKPFIASNGIVSFNIENIPSRTKKLYLNAVDSGTSGISDLKSETDFESLPWYSKSSSFLVLRTLRKPLKVGETARIHFVFTNKETNRLTFVYQLICRGYVIISERKNLQTRQIKQSVYEGTLEFPVNQAMVPSCRLLVYYTRKDGEIVADSMVVDIQDKLENQVVVRLSNKFRRPGEPAQITITTTPGATVALAGIDQRVRTLQQDDELDVSKVTKVLSSHDVGPTDQYKKKKKCYKDEGHVDSSKAFSDSGIMYISDSDVESRPCRPFPTKPPPQPKRQSSSYSSSSDSESSDPDDCLCDIYPKNPWCTKDPRYRWKRYNLWPLFLRCSGYLRSGKLTSYREDQPKNRNKEPVKPVIKTRLNIPETWLWTEELISNSSGVKTITVQAPDTITSWYLSAFSMSSKRGMGVAQPSTLTVFQPFFISVNLPYSVIRGEEVSIVTTVFNYMSQCVTIHVHLSQTDHFILNSTADHNICICGNEAKSVKYVIIPDELGNIPLTVTVKTLTPNRCGKVSHEAPLGISSDTVTRKLLVEPEGVRQSYTYSDFVCPKAGSQSSKIDIQLPKKVVPDSVQATASVIGDVMGPSISGLEHLLDLPFGCGEQNMVNFAPNIYIMHYLNRTNQKLNYVQQKAVDFLQTGYQRELTYKRQDGSYSAFGDKDYEGSLWLTAFVLRSFSRASHLIFIDKNEIKSITKWIKNKQLDSGCFQTTGELFRKELKGGVSTAITLTAYVLIALLESQVDPKSDVIVKGFQCIVASKDNVTDSYSNAIIAYALTLGGHPNRRMFSQRLKSQATSKDGFMYWGKQDELPTHPTNEAVDEWTPPYTRSSSTSIETTAYALMALIGDGGNARSLARARPIVRWLSKQRNGHGGFASTQDTCVTLQALSQYAEHVYGKVQTWMRIDMGFRKNFSPTFDLKSNNRMVLQRALIPPKMLPMVLPYDIHGRGCALIQVDVSYNVPKSHKKEAFRLQTTIAPAEVKEKVTLTTEAGEELCQPLEMNVCADWLGSGSSDMAVVEVKLISGFEPVEESLEKLLNRADLGLMRFDVNDTKVVFYFNQIQTVCFSFVIHQSTIVKNTKQSYVTVYDYYDIDKSAIIEYTITEELCRKNTPKKETCPLCPLNVDLEVLQPLLCNMTTVFHLQSSKLGQTKVILQSWSRKENGYQFEPNQKRGPVNIQLSKQCSCPILAQPTHSYVLLKDRKDDEQINSLNLDENAVVLEKTTSLRKIPLDVILAKCGNDEIDAKRRRL